MSLNHSMSPFQTRRRPGARLLLTGAAAVAILGWSAIAQEQDPALREPPVAGSPAPLQNQPPQEVTPAEPSRTDAVDPTIAQAAQQQATPTMIIEDGWPLTLRNPFAHLIPRPAKLARGDLVLLTMYGMNGPGVPTPFYVHVATDGSIGVPLVGPVQVEGLTTDRAAARVSQALADASLVRDGIVTVGLVQTAAESGLEVRAIGVGDPLMVTVFDLVNPGRRLVTLALVGEDGQIELPLAGPVKIDGLTEAQADLAVQERFRDRRVLPRATVSVLRLAPPRDDR